MQAEKDQKLKVQKQNLVLQQQLLIPKANYEQHLRNLQNDFQQGAVQSGSSSSPMLHLPTFDPHTDYFGGHYSLPADHPERLRQNPVHQSVPAPHFQGDELQ